MGRLAADPDPGVLRALVDLDEALARARGRRATTRSTALPRDFAEMLDLMRADPDNVDRGARVLFAAHYLERIGDRVTNVAEDVVFLATGETEDLNP